MKSKLPFVGLLAVASVGAAPFSHAAPPEKPHHRPKPTAKTAVARPPVAVSDRADGLLPNEYMPTADVRTGMKGYGLSVFSGNKIEKFDVTVLGLLRKSNNGRDLILCKLSGPAMHRVSDIIAGMSGSPVYVNGRLLGAVSMGFAFTREPIGMITPIEDMLDAWDPAIPQTPYFDAPNSAPSTAPTTTLLDVPLHIDRRTYTRVAIASADRSVAAPHAADTLVARPCLSPVNVSGVSKRRFAAVAAAFKKLGIDARDDVGAAMNPDLTPSPLTPGGALGMSLVTGDLDVTAIGTLTYRRGDRIVAFGHPFLNIGPLDAPMFSAYIHDLLPSYQESEKLGSPVRMVGAFSQDRPYSVGGRIGAKPALVPVTVRITDRMLGRDRMFHANILQHPQFTATLATTAAGTAIDNVHAFPGDAMATVDTEVVADGIGTIRHTNRFYDGAAISDAATSDLQTLVALLSSNAFYPVGIKSVTMHVVIDRGRQTAQVERIFLKQTRYEPGDTVDVGVVLKPYKGDRIYKELQVKIPAGTAPGTLVMTVQGGPGSGGAVRFGGMTFLPSGGGSDYALATSVAQIAHKFEERERNDDLIAHLVLPTAAPSVGGERLSGLPPALDAAMRSNTRTSGILLDRDEVKVAQRTDYVLSGAQAIAIRVVRHGAPPDGTPTPPPTTPSGASPTIPGAPAGGTIPAAPPSGNSLDAPSIPSADLMTPRAAASSISPSGRADYHADARAVARAVVTKTKATKSTPPPVVVTATPPPIAPASMVSRQPGVWHQSTAADFRQGTMQGVTVTSNGDIRVAPRLISVAQTIAPYFWSLADGPDKSVFAGSGDDGTIYRVDAESKASVFAHTGELEVQALLSGADGNLYAGTAPHGAIFRIGADGVAEQLDFVYLKDNRDAEKNRYILALATSPDGKTLYAATGGDTGRVLQVIDYAGVTAEEPASLKANGPSANAVQGKPEIIYTGTEGSVTSLAVAPDGSVYAGTAPSGLVLKIAGPGVDPGHPTVLYDARDASISGLALAPDGTLYATTAPHGTLVRISTAAVGSALPVARVIYDRATNGGGGLVGVVVGPDGLIYAAASSSVIAVDPVHNTTATIDPSSDIQILTLLRSAQHGLLVGTGNTAGIYQLAGSGGPGGATGQYVSSVLDTQTGARWGTIRWSGDRPTGAVVVLETRSGSTPEPDAGWSDWSRHYLAGAGDTIASPPARFLQYRATLSGTGATLDRVDIFYLTPNQAPQVTILYPRGGETLRGTPEIRWSGTDPDHDTLAYSLAISGDNGATWKPIDAAANLIDRADTPTTIAPPGRETVTATVPAGGSAAPPNNAAADLAAELSKHPEISAEMRARILADAPATVAAPGSTVITMSAPLAGPTVENAPPTGTRGTDFEFDTSGYPDGAYRLRVTATDRPSNASGALTDEKISPAFRIANHAPSLFLFSNTAGSNPDRTYHVEGIALHPSVAIRGVQYRIDGGEWLSAAANDGIFDSVSEGFTITTAPLTPGIHTMDVQATDEAGNTVSTRRTVR